MFLTLQALSVAGKSAKKIKPGGARGALSVAEPNANSHIPFFMN